MNKPNVSEINLEESPGLSSINVNRWNDGLLAVSTWGNSTKVYNTYSGELVKTYTFDCPQLSTVWAGENLCVSGGADGVISINQVEIGSHNSPISSITFVENTNQIITTAYDGTIKSWDSRSHSLIFDLSLQYKVVGSTPQGISKVICGCSDRIIFELDTRDPASTGKQRESSLKYNISSIAANQDTLAVGSFECRIAIEKLNSKNDEHFTVKGHNEIKEGKRIVYPVNTMIFNPSNGYLATGGGDAKVIVWDYKNRRTVHELGPYKNSISSISYSNDGKLLAIASSYGFEHGRIDHPDDQLILIRSDILI